MPEITGSYGFSLGCMLIPLPGVGLHLVGGCADPSQQLAPPKQVVHKGRGARVQGIQNHAGHLGVEQVVEGEPQQQREGLLDCVCLDDAGLCCSVAQPEHG